MPEAVRKAKVVVHGCQMNERDSETVGAYLKKAGYALTGDAGDADLILYMTCCVRGNAEDRAMGNLGEAKRLKRSKPGLLVGICGCMAQEEWVKEELAGRLSWIDLAFGTHNIHRLPELLSRLDDGQRVIEIWDSAQEVVEDLPVLRKDPLKSFVNITYGCDNFCAYCIVPYVRGRERSRQPREILRECQEAVESGARDITLLGQNVNAYGKGLADVDGRRPDFTSLLRLLNDEMPDGVRIRFTTSHPRFVDDGMIEALARLDKVCEHYHLPMQAGSDRVLRAMNRGYTSEQYLGLLYRVRRAVPGCAITSDIMVGFPGETEEDFQDTMRAVEAARFDAAFTFVYSPRKGTAAEKMQGQVSEEEKKDRIGRLIELQNRISLEVNRQLAGTAQEVMAEGPS
nr:tRNA (N6-isopentenyl adenosine(37)-C2)-methylthiotransferase MiaB [Bacillota bacterium]